MFCPWQAKLGVVGCFQYWTTGGHRWQNPCLRDHSELHRSQVVPVGRHCIVPKGPLGSIWARKNVMNIYIYRYIYIYRVYIYILIIIYVYIIYILLTYYFGI